MKLVFREEFFREGGFYVGIAHELDVLKLWREP